MTPNPTQPGIAELLDDYVQACFDGIRSGVTLTDRDEARAAILAHVAAIEAQRDEALKECNALREKAWRYDELCK